MCCYEVQFLSLHILNYLQYQAGRCFFWEFDLTRFDCTRRHGSNWIFFRTNKAAAAACYTAEFEDSNFSHCVNPYFWQAFTQHCQNFVRCAGSASVVTVDAASTNQSQNNGLLTCFPNTSATPSAWQVLSQSYFRWACLAETANFIPQHGVICNFVDKVAPSCSWFWTPFWIRRVDVYMRGKLPVRQSPPLWLCLCQHPC